MTVGERTYLNIGAIFDVLRRHPSGVTAKIVATELNWPPANASNRLSRLALYGVLDRVPDPEREINGRAYRYTAKQRAPEHV